MARRTTVLTAWALVVLAVGVSVAGEEAPATDAVLRGLGSADFASRRDAVWSARDHPDPVYLAPLLRMARQDPHANVRAFAIEALARYEDERIVPTVLDALAKDASPGPQRAALTTLGRTGDPRAYAPLIDHLEAGRIGGAALRGLAVLGDARAFAAALALWDAHPDDPWIADAAPAALVSLSPDRGREALLDRFSRVPPWARRAVVAVLSSMDDAAVRAAMARALTAEDPGLRDGAIRVLGAIGDGPTDARLLDRFRKAPADRPALADALGRRDVHEAVPDLAEALAAKDTTKEGRRAIAAALGALGDPRAVPALATVFPTEDDPVAAVEEAVALGRLGDERALGPLRTAMDDPRVSTQSPHVSAVWPYPHNVRVGDAAVWAVATIREGRPPFPVDALSAFPTPPRPSAAAALSEARRRFR